MWAALERRIQVYILVASTIATVLLLQAVIGVFSSSRSTFGALRYISLASFIIGTGLVFAFNRYWRWLWRRFPAVEKAIFPDLNGTWKGTLQTTWINPDTGQPPGPIDVTVWIRQDLLNISVVQQTKESPSYSTRAVPLIDRSANKFGVWYSYDNRPHANVGFRSSDHEGVARLEMEIDKDKRQLRGRYYTSRKTSGDMYLTKFSTNLVDPPDRENWASGTMTNFQ